MEQEKQKLVIDTNKDKRISKEEFETVMQMLENGTDKEDIINEMRQAIEKEGIQSPFKDFYEKYIHGLDLNGQLDQNSIIIIQGYANLFGNSPRKIDITGNMDENTRSFVNIIKFRKPQKIEYNGVKKFSIEDKLRDINKNLAQYSGVEGFDEERAKMLFKIGNSLNNILSNQTIPDEVKYKYITDVDRLIKNLKQIDPKDIQELREIRKEMSFGEEKDMSDGHYLRVLLEQNGINEIPLKGAVINRCFVDETQDIEGKTYHKATKDRFLQSVRTKDQKYGVNFSEFVGIDCLDNEIPIRNKIFGQILGGSSLDATQKGFYNEMYHRNGEIYKIPIDVNGKTYLLKDIVDDYMQSISYFRQNQEVLYTDLKANILDEGFAQGMKGEFEDVFGLEKIPVNDDIEQRFSEKLDHMDTADIYILLVQFAGLLPYVGDSSGGYFDGRQAIQGISPEGKKLGGFDRAFLGILAVLEISVVGSLFAKLPKAMKAAKLMKMTEIAISKLDDVEKINSLRKSKKGAELYSKIDNGSKSIPLLDFARRLYLPRKVMFDELIKDERTMNHLRANGGDREFIRESIIQKLQKEGFDEIDIENKFGDLINRNTNELKAYFEQFVEAEKEAKRTGEDMMEIFEKRIIKNIDGRDYSKLKGTNAIKAIMKERLGKGIYEVLETRKQQLPYDILVY